MPTVTNGDTDLRRDGLELTKGANCGSQHPPTALLDERASEAEIVSRLLAAGVDRDDFDHDDPEWREFATGLIEYGYGVLFVWGFKGRLPTKVALYGGRRLPGGTVLNMDDAHALAVEVLMVAIEKFRTRSLRSWDATGGASLRAYFIGLCLLVTGQVYEGWYRRERRPLPLDPRFVDDGRNGHRPDEEAEARVLVDQVLEDDPDLRRVLELQGQGYSLDEIAGNLHTTGDRLKSRIFRAKERIRKGGSVRD